VSAAERYPEPIIADELTPCDGHTVEQWETIGKIEALKERITRDRPCTGPGWFHVTLKGGRAVARLCSIHAAQEMLHAGGESCQSVILRCSYCSHRGSHTAAGVEVCNRCERPSRVRL
jgi:hypothetical protein